MTPIERIVAGLFTIMACGLLLLAYAKDAKAEGVNVGPNCSIRWSASSGIVDGYRVYIGSQTARTQRAQVTGTTASCADLRLTPGQNYVHVTAFNVAGESGATDPVPFVVVTAVPGVPTGLVVLP